MPSCSVSRSIYYYADRHYAVFITLSVVMLSAIMLSVVAPFLTNRHFCPGLIFVGKTLYLGVPFNQSLTHRDTHMHMYTHRDRVIILA